MSVSSTAVSASSAARLRRRPRSFSITRLAFSRAAARSSLAWIAREIVENKRLVFTFTWDNGPSGGVETLVTITFEEKGGKTVQTFHQRPFLNVERRDSHVGGWTSAFDKLAAYAALVKPNFS